MSAAPSSLHFRHMGTHQADVGSSRIAADCPLDSFHSASPVAPRPPPLPGAGRHANRIEPAHSNPTYGPGAWPRAGVDLNRRRYAEICETIALPGCFSFGQRTDSRTSAVGNTRLFLDYRDVKTMVGALQTQVQGRFHPDFQSDRFQQSQGA